MAHKYLIHDPIRTARFLLNSISETAVNYNVHQQDLCERAQLRMDNSKVLAKVVNCEIRIGSDMYALQALRTIVPSWKQEEFKAILDEAIGVTWLCGMEF